MEIRGKGQPGCEIICIKSADIAPWPNLSLVGCPVLFPRPAVRSDKNKGCLGWVYVERLGSTLFIIVIRLLLWLRINPHLPRRQTIWHESIPSFSFDGSVIPPIARSFARSHFEVCNIAGSC